MSQDNIDQVMQQAVGLHRAGRLAEAKAKYFNVLAEQPNNPDALHLLGIIAIQSGQPDQAIEWIRQAIAIKPNVADYQSNLGSALHNKGFVDEAISVLRKAIRLNPDLAEAHVNLSNSLLDRGLIDDAILACHRALTLNPRAFEAHNNLGNAFQEKGEFVQAIAAYRQALEINPNVPETHNNLGNALRTIGCFDEAIAAYRRAIELRPNMHQAHGNLGSALRDAGRLGEAIASLRQCLRLKPDYADALGNLGLVLCENGQLDEAVAACREAIRLKPELAEAYRGLGNALLEKGQLDEAVSAYRRAIGLNPGWVDVHSNLLFALSYHSDYDAQAILSESRSWSRRHAGPLEAEILPHDNDPSPDRKLKIGFVSPDFRGHPVGYSLLPLFVDRQRQAMEFVCYSDVRNPDGVTAELKRSADQWHNVLGIPDQRLAEKIRQDRIDILVDTTLHTARNRLLVFARKPAPVQVTYMAYPGTSGLDTIDYRITDPYLDPPGTSDGDYSEKSIRLPHSFWIFRPPPYEISPSDLPATANGFVTFGCLNRFPKVTRPALDLWLQILQSVPNSRLLIQSQPGDHLDAIRQLFQAGGVASDRLQFLPRTSQEEYLRRYHQLDICLDPMPYNGHFSSLDALWMGVPTVTLRGKTGAGRGGVSILSNVGLTDWIADSPEQYIALARQMAADLPRLAELRRTLRQRMLNSPLADGKQFALDVQSAFRQMWQTWCARPR